MIAFHDHILLPIITLITLLVLGLIIYVVVRFNKRSNPTPARFSHNTPVEVAWTVMPVLILMFIAIFSFRLLFEEHDMPKPYMTVKVVGRQWNWDYEYPDQKIGAYTSTVMTEPDAAAKHLPYQLATNAPLLAPVNKVVRVQVTAEDVIHSFSVPCLRHQDRRHPRTAEPDLVQGQPARHLLWPVLAAVRHQPQLHADRGQGREPTRVRRLGAEQGARAEAPPWSPRQAPAAAVAATPAPS